MFRSNQMNYMGAADTLIIVCKGTDHEFLLTLPDQL